MSKYLPLWSFLKENFAEELTFDQIKSILGFEIDHSFLTCKKEAEGFGFKVDKISMKEKKISFKKL